MLQDPDVGELLTKNGSNLASVLARMKNLEPEIYDRVTDYLRQVAPEVTNVEPTTLGPKETLSFRQEVKGAAHPWRFFAANMSDGTLRALGVLVALMQLNRSGDRVRLIGIEEPETALHPAATGVLMDSIREAAESTQVMLTTHSTTLLDEYQEDTDSLFVVVNDGGITSLGPVGPSTQQTVREHLYTAGELLRQDHLTVDRRAVERQRELRFDFQPDDEGAH